MKRKPGAHGRKSSKAPVIGTLRKKEHLLGSESSVPQAIRLKHNWKRRSKKKKIWNRGRDLLSPWTLQSADAQPPPP